MTDTSGAFPTLGFDPLPGDPEVAKALRDDAAEFGRRMTQEASRLKKLAHRDGWQGLAADVFAQHLETLPRDLERCGQAFSDLAVELTKYHTAFVAAKCEAKALEERAAAAKQTVQQAEFTYSAPVIQAPGDCPPVRDRGPLNDAEDSYGAILREAHAFAENFNERCEVQAMATAIRNCTRFAPDEPGWSVFRRWAGTVFRATPIGDAIGGIHDLINEYAEFFNDLAGFLADVSGTLGLLTLPLMFFPPAGTAAAVLALGFAVGSATVKTSLYAGRARDANGNLYVSGGTLLRSYFDVGVNALGVGATAGAARAADIAAARAAGITGKVPGSLGEALGDQFATKVFRGAAAVPKNFKTDVADLGYKGALKLAAKTEALRWGGMSGSELVLNGGGVLLSTMAPVANASEGDSWNVGGWRSAQHLILDDPTNLLTNAPDSPDLVKTAPANTSGDRPSRPATLPPSPPPQPVMGDRE